MHQTNMHCSWSICYEALVFTRTWTYISLQCCDILSKANYFWNKACKAVEVWKCCGLIHLSGITVDVICHLTQNMNINLMHFYFGNCQFRKQKLPIYTLMSDYGIEPLFNFNPAWISNQIPRKVWDENTYPFPKFNNATVEVWKWISNFILHIILDVITYLCWD